MEACCIKIAYKLGCVEMSSSFKNTKMDKFFEKHSEDKSLYVESELASEIERLTDELIVICILKHDLQNKASFYDSSMGTSQLSFHIYNNNESKIIIMNFKFIEKNCGWYFDEFGLNIVRGELIDLKKIKQEEEHSGFSFKNEKNIHTFSSKGAVEILKQSIILI